MPPATAVDRGRSRPPLAQRALAAWRPSTRGPSAEPGGPEPTARRRPLLVLGGLFIVVACAAVGASVAGDLDHRAAFLVAAETIPVGATIAPDDLATVSFTPAPGLDALPVADAGDVLGRRTSVRLGPGVLVVPGDLTTGAGIPVGEALVGAALAPGQLPSGLGAGEHVLVVLSGTAGAAASSSAGGPAAPSGGRRGGSPTVAPSPTGPPGEVLAPAAVTSVDQVAGAGPTSGDGAADVVVTLEVPVAEAPAVTAASAAGDVSLAAVSPAGSRS